MITCKVALKGDDMLYFDVPTKDEADAFIAGIEEAINLGTTATFNGRNGRVVLNHKYIIRASYGALNN